MAKAPVVIDGEPLIPGKVHKATVNKYAANTNTREIWGGFSGIPSTCSAAEVNTPTNREVFARTLLRVKESGRKMAICNVASLYKSNMDMIKEFGFKKVGEYMGNHNMKVHTFWCDLNDL